MLKSIKPGRGPSAMGAFGGIIAAVFGVFWIIFAVSIGAPAIFPLFGILFIVMALGGTAFNYKNATGSNRMSVYDITDDKEEPDPLQARFHGRENSEPINSESIKSAAEFKTTDNNTDSTTESITDNSQDNTTAQTLNYCPYCRCELRSNYNYCPKCGNDLSNVK